MGDNDILSLSALLFGKQAWQPVRTHGSMFILDIGKSISRPGYKNPHGEWMLIVEQANWRIYKDGLLCASEHTERSVIDAAFDNIRPGIIRGFKFDQGTQGIAFDLENGVAIEVTHNDNDEVKGEDQWLIYGPSGVVWIANDRETKASSYN